MTNAEQVRKTSHNKKYKATNSTFQKHNFIFREAVGKLYKDDDIIENIERSLVLVDPRKKPRNFRICVKNEKIDRSFWKRVPCYNTNNWWYSSKYKQLYMYFRNESNIRLLSNNSNWILFDNRHTATSINQVGWQSVF